MCTDKVRCPLNKVIRTVKRECYSGDENVTEERVLGVMIAAHFGWNGMKILRTAADALEDANFHGECELVQRMMTNIKRGFTH